MKMQGIFVLIFVSQLVVLNAFPAQIWNQTLPKDVDPKKFMMNGDMIVEKEKKWTKSVGLDYKNQWPNGVVPYEIDYGYTSSQLSIIKRGMEILSTKTSGCITFVPKNSGHKNWVTIRPGAGCNSLVGMWGPGSQTINLQRGDCTYKGTVVHELMHALGFYHEQNRPDRDQYVRINYHNISPGLAFAFDKEYNTRYFNTPYDLKSIMQYYEYAFSSNGQKTIVPLNGETLVPLFDKTEAQILTDLDIMAVRDLYQCSGSVATTNKPQPTDSNFSSYSFSLNNNLSVKVDMYWVDYTGSEVLYSTLYPGQAVKQTSHKDHTWRVRGSGYDRTFTIGKGKFTQQSTYIYLSTL